MMDLVFFAIEVDVSTTFESTTLCEETESVELLNVDSKVRFWLNIFIVPVLVIFGVTGNVLAFIVIDKINFGLPSSKTLIKALATCDILYLLGSLLFQTMRTIQYDTTWLGDTYIYPYLHPIVWPYMTTTLTIATWITVAIAADRYIAVEFPFRAITVCSSKKAKLFVKILVVSSIIFNFPHCFEYKWDERISCSGTVSVHIAPTDLFLNDTYQIVYWSVLTLLIRFIFPLTILFVLTAGLICTIKKAKRHHHHRNTMRVKRAKKDYVTPVLIAVIISFIFCQTTEFIMHILTTVRWTNENYRGKRKSRSPANCKHSW